MGLCDYHVENLSQLKMVFCFWSHALKLVNTDLPQLIHYTDHGNAESITFTFNNVHSLS